MFDRFTQDAKRTMNLARQASQKLNHEYLGTEHILLGLLDVGDCTAVVLLRQMGVDPGRIRTETERVVSRGPSAGDFRQLPFTAGAKKVLELSMMEAGRLGHRTLGTGHLLLGLMGEHEGVGCRVLTSLGVTPERVLKQFLELRGESIEDLARLDREPDSIDREAVIDRLRAASALLQQMGESIAARKIDEIVIDLQSRS